MSDRELKCTCNICSIPDSLLSLSAKIKVCPLQRQSVACDKLFSQIPLTDAKIIKDDFKWIAEKIAAVCRFADRVEEEGSENENLKTIRRKVACSLLPFDADIGLDAGISSLLIS
jgi:hypothetical protein